MSIDPTQQQLEQLAAIAGGGADGPLVMLNLNRYRERAAYAADPEDGVEPDVSGREAYARYGVVAMGVIHRVGGSIVWSTGATLTVVGEQQERFDDVIAVRYPSAQAFLDLVADPAMARAKVHRDAGLEHAVVIRCDDAGAGPLRGL